jgi:hypothetical protein
MSRADIVVAFFIALVAASLLVMWLSRQTTQARRTHCEHKQIALSTAIQLHERIHEELPGWRQAGGESWSETILPWIGRVLNEDELSGKAPVDISIRGPHATAMKADTTSGPPFIWAFVCPEDPRVLAARSERGAWLSYVVNAGRPDGEGLAAGEAPDNLGSGVFLDYSRGPDRMTLDFIAEHDGESYTLLLSENIDAGRWPDHAEQQLTFLWNIGEPHIFALNDQAGRGDGSVSFARPSSRHLNGVNATFVGGNTQFLSNSIDPHVFRQMMTSDQTQDE